MIATTPRPSGHWLTDAGRRALATDDTGRLDVTRYCQLLDEAAASEADRSATAR